MTKITGTLSGIGKFRGWRVRNCDRTGVPATTVLARGKCWAAASNPIATAVHKGLNQRVTFPGIALDSWRITGKPKERAARIAGVDGGVGLDEADSLVGDADLRTRSTRSADNAHSHGIVQT